MQSKFYLMIGMLFALMYPALSAQPSRRLAIVETNGSLARAVPIWALAESQITDDLTAKLTGQPGITVVDRANVERILKEQNFQNSDRSSSDTAVRLGKLLGVGQVVMVNLYDLKWSVHPEQQGRVTHTMGTTVVRANARLIDVETGAILSQPASEFQESVQLSEATQPVQFGNIRVPGKEKSNGDPQVIQGDEWAKGKEAVTSELAAKLKSGIAGAPGPKAPAALVAGIANGNVYINQGTTAGVKAGDRYQVVRQVSVGLDDPSTGKPIVQKQRVCVLTVVNVDESSASGACQGGLPRSKDEAEPIQP